MVKQLLGLCFWLKTLSSCCAFYVDVKRPLLPKIAQYQSIIRLFSQYDEQSPFDGSAQPYQDIVVQQQIDAYLEERSQLQIEEYLALMNESSGGYYGEEAMGISGQEEEDSKNLMQKIKDSGVAGIIAFAVVQIGFWLGTFPFVVLAFYKVTGHFPDFNSQEDMAFFGGESFAFVNVLRLAAPFRIGFALKLVPWIQENVIDRFNKGGDTT